jgi:GNAT superfamily N-acetyltransferase
MTAVIIVPHPVETSPAIEFRRLQPADRVALLEMYERCSPASRYRRWHGHTAAFPAAYLAAVLSGGDEPYAIVAVCGAQIVAMASLHADGPATREFAMLVEDAHQLRGIGRSLLARLVDHACRGGTRRLLGEMLSEDAWLVRLLQTHGPTTTRSSYGILTATVEL